MRASGQDAAAKRSGITVRVQRVSVPKAIPIVRRHRGQSPRKIAKSFADAFGEPIECRLRKPRLAFHPAHPLRYRFIGRHREQKDRHRVLLIPRTPDLNAQGHRPQEKRERRNVLFPPRPVAMQ